MSIRTARTPTFRPAPPTSSSTPTAIDDSGLFDEGVRDLAEEQTTNARARAEADLRDAAIRFVSSPGDVVGRRRFASGTVLAVEIAKPRIAQRRRGGLMFRAGERATVTIVELADADLERRQALGESIISAAGAAAILEDDALAVFHHDKRVGRPVAVPTLAEPPRHGRDYLEELELELLRRRHAFWTFDKAARSEELEAIERIESEIDKGRCIIERQEARDAQRRAVIASNTPRGGGRGVRGPIAATAHYRAPLVDVLSRLAAKGWGPRKLARLILTAPTWNPPAFNAIDLQGDDEAAIERKVSRLRKARREP